MAKSAKRGTDHTQERPIDWNKIVAIMKKNYIVMTRDKVRLVPLLIFPLIMITVLGFVTGTSPKHIAAVVVIGDESPLSQTLQQRITGSDYFAIKYMVSTEGEARELLDNGLVRAIIEIPPGLQDDIDSGMQPAITVIVDESDSAVAATARAQANAIVAGLAGEMAARSYAGYQRSVAGASDAISGYATQDSGPWNQVQALTANAATTLDLTNQRIDSEVDTMLRNPPETSRRIVDANSSVSYHGREVNITTGTFFNIGSPAAEAAKAQVSQLRGISQSIGAAQAQSASANALAMVAGTQAAQHAAAKAQAVEKPLAVIKAFTQSDPIATLRPITYNEKSAYGTGLKALDFMIPVLIVTTLFQGAVMGMGRAVAGEKRDGSLTRVFLTPTSNTTIIVGTLSFYILFELVRAIFLLVFSIIVFDVTISGNPLLILAVLLTYLGISTGIGMLISAVVKTEQQFIAMAMLISLPTMFLGGAFFPIQSMPSFMQAIANFLPVTYASEALRSVMVKNLGVMTIVRPSLILMLFLAVVLGALFTLFRRDIE